MDFFKYLQKNSGLMNPRSKTAPQLVTLVLKGRIVLVRFCIGTILQNGGLNFCRNFFSKGLTCVPTPIRDYGGLSKLYLAHVK